MLIEASATLGTAELTVIAPCYNEKRNVVPLIEKLTAALRGIEWEVVFVDDDSPDGTAAEIRALAQTNRRVRCVQRIGRHGLSTAVIEGMLTSAAPYLAVIDADLQHDERLLPLMLASLKTEPLDIVVGSRYVRGGSIGDWNAQRAAMSDFATRLSRLIVKQDISDPMSGYFMLKRPAFESCVRRLSGYGFKILLDLFASTPKPLRFKELAYSFRARQHGESKLDSVVIVEYGLLLLDKLIGWLLPIRFVMFAAVNALGVLVHLAVLALSLALPLGFVTAQFLATFAAMTSNFFINNILTYRDRRLRGRKLIAGLLSFYAICSAGALANVGIASIMYRDDYSWFLSAIAGIAVGVVWNYAMSATFTWRK